MLNGIIFVKDSILSLDLKTSLSKYFKIVNVFKKIDTLPENLEGIDFMIIDTDPFSEQVFRSILDKLNLDKKVKVIAITSNPELHEGSLISNKILKPIDNLALIQTIQAV